MRLWTYIERKFDKLYDSIGDISSMLKKYMFFHKHRNISYVTNFLKRPFVLIDDISSRLWLIFLAGLFACIFFVGYNPLGIGQYFINSQIGQVIPVQWVGVIGAITLAVSQLVLRPTLGLDHLTIGKFLLWSSCELLLLSIVVFIIYGERGRPFWDEFMLTTYKTFILSVVPITIAYLTIALIKTKDRSSAILPKEMVDFQFVSLKDERGKVVMHLKKEDLIYLKTEDNYISVSYITSLGEKRQLIRNNLKNIEGDLLGSSILRIHRSYMVNVTNISSISRHAGRTEVRMKHLSNDVLRVSSSYRSSFESFIAQWDQSKYISIQP